MEREEAIRRIKAWNLDSDDMEVLAAIIPELAESKDERIIRLLRELGSLNAAKELYEEFNLSYTDVLYWLEKQKEKPTHTAKEAWKEMRLEVYAQASGNRHEPNCSDDSTKMFSLCNIDEIFEKIGDFTVEPQPVKCIEYKFDYEFENQVSHLIASVLNKEYEYSVGFVKHAAQSLLGYAKNELKTNYCLYGGYPNVGRCRWCSAACSARLTDVHTDDEKEYIRTIKSIISDFIRDKKPEYVGYYQRICDWLDGRHVPFSCDHENGKTSEWSELQSEFKNINEAFENGKKEVIDHPDKYGLTKQKPVDFPTTDEEVKEFLGTHPKVEVPEKYKTPDFLFSKQEYESHPIISTDTTSTKPVEFDGKTLLYTADKSYQIGFRDGVASVKPAEWSEEGEEMRGTCIDLLEHFPRPCGEVIGPWKDCITWLKSLRPSWKPNEEQMEALDKARRFIPYNCDALESLYNDLKKLT